MLKNFFKTTIRVLYQNKGFAFINIMGLAIGFACCIFIALYINHEIGFDRFHKDVDRLYRLTVNFSINNEVKENLGITSPKMGEDLLEEIPEIEQVLRLGFTGGEFKYKEKNIVTKKLLHTDTTLWDMLSFKLLLGNPKTCLTEPFTIVLSENLANSFFGNENPVGKVILKDGRIPYIVTGVVQDCPSNTRIEYDGFVAFSTLYKERVGIMTEWDGNFNFNTILRLSNGANPNEVIRRVNAIADEGINAKLAQANVRISMGLQAVKHTHLYNDLNYEKPGVARVLVIISSIALFILFIAGFNFVNLTTARSTRRAKEVGLRMTVGASKGMVRMQFLGESVLLALVSALISLLIVELMMPSYNNLLGLNLSLYTKESVIVGLSLPIFIFLFGVVAGLYPAFFLASFKPIKVLKADFGGAKSKPFIRNALVTMQFVISSLLIIATTVVYMQLNYLKSKDLGLDTRGLLFTYAKGENMWQSIESLKTIMLEIPEIESVAISTSSLGYGVSQNGFTVEDNEYPMMISSLGIDYDYLNVIGAKIVEGRNLSVLFPSDETAAIVNQTLVKLAGWDNPIGKKLIREKEFVVVGVVEDFHYKSLHAEIEPLAMFLPFDFYLRRTPTVNIKIKEGMIAPALEKIGNKWIDMNMPTEFNYNFLQDIFNAQYKTEENFGKLFVYFSFLAVFISCLGLIGLTSFMLENKRKEIGIRKVLGSGVGLLIGKFSIDYTRWAVLGIVISWPIALYAITQLLNNYPYRIDTPWIVFAVTALLTFAVAILTVVIQTFRAAKSNPVESLKYE
jgi:putative ABC transport system permease protein